MFDSKNTILYIGKAKNLKRRVSSYATLKPGKCTDAILEMIDSVQMIRWQECKSEKKALNRETELLHAIRPPYNILNTETEHYLYLGIRQDSTSKKCPEKHVKLSFQLSSRTQMESDGYRVYGCFKHRRKTKDGYSALLRLIHAATYSKPRFNYPAPLTRIFPPWLFSTTLPAEWRNPLDRFLKGKDRELLRILVQNLIENENIPPFMRASIQEDIEIAKVFYRVGPKFTRARVLTHSQMDDLITMEYGIDSHVESA